MFSEELLYKSFFIALMSYGKIVIRPTKKLVTSYMVGNLAFLD